jgi:hypothetical protein
MAGVGCGPERCSAGLVEQVVAGPRMWLVYLQIPPFAASESLSHRDRLTWRSSGIRKLHSAH